MTDLYSLGGWGYSGRGSVAGARDAHAVHIYIPLYILSKLGSPCVVTVVFFCVSSCTVGSYLDNIRVNI